MSIVFHQFFSFILKSSSDYIIIFFSLFLSSFYFVSFVPQRLSEKSENLKFEIWFYLEMSQQSK